MKAKLLFALAAVLSLALPGAFAAKADTIVPERYAIRHYAGQSGFSVYIDTENALYAAGSNGSGQLGRGFAGNEVKIEPAKVLENVRTAVTGKTGFTLAVSLSGELFGWGANKFAQLGQGTGYDPDAKTNYLSVPTPVDLPGVTIKAVAAGAAHSVVLSEEGEVYTFGSNLAGQLGLGLEADGKAVRGLASRIPRESFGGERVTAIASAEYTTFALTESGGVYAWGENDFGLLATGNEDVTFCAISPVKTKLDGIRAISAASTTGMALGQDGRVSVWGNNSFSQFGAPGFAESMSALPVAVEGYYDDRTEMDVRVAQILCGGTTNFVLSEAGDVFAFGSGGNGQAGFDILAERYRDHPYVRQSNVTAPMRVTFYQPKSIYELTENGTADGKSPVDTSQVLDVKVAELVGSIGNRTFVLDEDGNMWSWGDNTSGLAASGDVNGCLVPVRSTLYRNDDYDKEVKKKNYLIKPAVTLCVIFGLAIVWAAYTEIKNARLRKKFKTENPLS